MHFYFCSNKIRANINGNWPLMEDQAFERTDMFFREYIQISPLNLAETKDQMERVTGYR